MLTYLQQEALIDAYKAAMARLQEVRTIRTDLIKAELIAHSAVEYLNTLRTAFNEDIDQAIAQTLEPAPVLPLPEYLSARAIRLSAHGEPAANEP